MGETKNEKERYEKQALKKEREEGNEATIQVTKDGDKYLISLELSF